MVVQHMDWGTFHIVSVNKYCAQMMGWTCSKLKFVVVHQTKHNLEILHQSEEGTEIPGRAGQPGIGPCAEL